MEQIIMILENKKLKYNTARDRILDAILSGGLAENLMLPSEQELGRRLGIGRNTVRTALRELEQDGIIIKQNGRPSRVNQAALRKQSAPLRHIAWVVTASITRVNPIYLEIFRSVSEAAVTRSVRLDYIHLSIEGLAENFFKRQMEYDGLILGEITRAFEKHLSEIKHPNCICVDCPHPGIPHCVKTDSYLGGQLAAQTLIESGYRCPAFIGYSETVTSYSPFQERLRGFQDYLAQAGFTLPSERILLMSCPDDEDRFSEFLKKNLPILKKADSLFVITDRFAVAAVYALPELGLRIPDNLAVIGFDGQTYSRFVSPVLTTIQQPVKEIGRKALEIVLNPAESASYPEIVQIPPVLQSGATVSAKKDKSSVLSNKTTKTRKGKQK